MIDKMHALRWSAPSHCRIIKWRVTYEQANELAHELAALQGLGGMQSPVDILGTIKDGTAKMRSVPVVLRETGPATAPTPRRLSRICCT